MNRASPSPAHVPRGFSFSAAACGLKKSGLDLGLIVSQGPASAAAVFTTNRVKAAPVLLSQKNLAQARARMRAIIVNSGNANCATGSAGVKAAESIARSLSKKLPCRPQQILVCSTGVIGVPLPAQKIIDAIPRLLPAHSRSAQGFLRFTRAIMTTDTRPKLAFCRFRARNKIVRLAGCAKGAGMIQPQMATMLAFVLTDARIAPALLRKVLRSAAERSFNRISVDGDTSTNDTLAVFANGASGAAVMHKNRPAAFKKFSRALEQVCRSLALQVVSDGEGATRVAQIEVRGATSERAAAKIARAIATSPLVKTALASSDPNWGRILAAAGRAPLTAAESRNVGRASIRLGGALVCREGRAFPFNEAAVRRHLRAKRVAIVFDLRAGPGRATMLTCDLTADYVRINASYRT